MSDFAIRIRDLGKRYQLGLTHAGSIREAVGRVADRLLGRTRELLPHEQATAEAAASRGGVFWALRNVTFDVAPGEVVGIIGRNGAGKSTFLKIVSRITTPTEGRVEINGRVASLLEVGTGFHPELTGRENIFLNGAILGMTKAEIRRKFDQIVDFSGVERFLETPVKRYSSGMSVRLGFAVAAHLDPEILVVDEVLAVGDADFQKKCLGKMHEVASSGRTVLFVSHNLRAVERLCTSAVLLSKGRLEMTGASQSVVRQYLAGFDENPPDEHATAAGHGEGRVSLSGLGVADASGRTSRLCQAGSAVTFQFSLHCDEDLFDVAVHLGIYNHYDQLLALLESDVAGAALSLRAGESRFVCTIPNLPLLEGTFYLNLAVKHKGRVVAGFVRAGAFDVVAGDSSPGAPSRGLLLLKSEWRQAPHAARAPA